MNSKHEYKIIITKPFKIEGNWIEMKPTHQIEDDVKEVKEILGRIRPGEECEVGISYREVLYVLTRVFTCAGYDCQVEEVNIKSRIFSSHKEAFEKLEKEYEQAYADAGEVQIIEADLCCNDAFIISDNWSRIDWKIEEVEVFKC